MPLGYKQFQGDSLLEDEFRLLEYIRSCAVILGLDGYYYQLSIEDTANVAGFEPEHQFVGACLTTKGAIDAIIQVHSQWREWTPEYLREVVVHELCHLYFKPHHELMTVYEDMFSPREAEHFEQLARLAEEPVVDNMSRALAEFLPLPEMPNETDSEVSSDAGAEDVRPAERQFFGAR